MMDQIGVVAAFSLASAAIGGFGQWLLSVWTARRQAEASRDQAKIADRKDSREALADAIEALRETMAEQREEVARLSRRVEAAERAEEACRGKLRIVRDAVHAMASLLQQRGIPAPDVPGWPLQAEE